MLTIQVIEDLEKNEFVIDIEEFHDVYGKGKTMQQAFKALALCFNTFLVENRVIMSNKGLPETIEALETYLINCYEENGIYFPLL